MHSILTSTEANVTVEDPLEITGSAEYTRLQKWCKRLHSSFVSEALINIKLN